MIGRHGVRDVRLEVVAAPEGILNVSTGGILLTTCCVGLIHPLN